MLYTESLKGFEMKRFWVFSYSPRNKNIRGFYHTSKTIDGLNLKKPFWVFSYSPRDKTFMGFPYK